MSKQDKKSLSIILFVLVLIISVTYGISFLARGYQISTKGKVSFLATGIISATSKPKGASVYIDDKLITATDDTINLPPSEYTIKIVKDGYLPWQKTVQIKKEIVYQTDTQLFRSSPDMKPITLTGAINPVISPDHSLVIYSVASASASKDNGLYLLELNNSLTFLSKNLPKQLSSNLQNLDWSKFNFIFSPNSKQILAYNTNNVNYLINLDNTTDFKNLYDITAKLSLIKEEWQTQEQQIIKSKIALLPTEIKAVISTNSAKNITFNSDETKLLYLAQADSSLKKDLITPPPAQSTQTQIRDIKKGNYYVYDLKDDTNFFIGSLEALYNPNWLANSNNLIYVEDQKIQTVEYDNTNKQTLFAGNFNKDVVYPWLDGNKIITLIAPYSNAQENLYSISIR